jgi:hypothetical protein
MSALATLLFFIVGCTAAIDLAHVLKGNRISTGLFAHVIRFIGVIGGLCLSVVVVMVGSVSVVVLAVVTAAGFVVVVMGALVLDKISAIVWRVKRLDWVRRVVNWRAMRKARGLSATDRLEVANATFDGRDPVLGDENRMKAHHLGRVVTNDGRIVTVSKPRP